MSENEDQKEINNNFNNKDFKNFKQEKEEKIKKNEREKMNMNNEHLINEFNEYFRNNNIQKENIINSFNINNNSNSNKEFNNNGIELFPFILDKEFEDKERYEQQDFENKYKNEKKNIFDEIKEYRGKTNIEFIEFVLEKYPPKKSPLKPNQTIRNLWEKDAKSFVEKLSARYNPDNYPKNTEEEKLKYTIYRTISTEINSILSELNPNTTTCE